MAFVGDRDNFFGIPYQSAQPARRFRRVGGTFTINPDDSVLLLDLRFGRDGVLNLPLIRTLPQMALYLIKPVPFIFTGTLTVNVHPQDVAEGIVIEATPGFTTFVPASGAAPSFCISPVLLEGPQELTWGVFL